MRQHPGGLLRLACRGLPRTVPCAILVLAGCATPTTEVTGANAAPPAVAITPFASFGEPADGPGALEPVTALRIGMVAPNLGEQLPLAVARDQGWFREAGLAVETITIPSGGPVMTAMLVSGDVSGMVSGIDSQLAAIAAGAPIVLIAGATDKVDFSLIGVKELTHVTDLHGGKTVGVTGVGTFSELTVVEALRRVGLVRNHDYTTRPVPLGEGTMAALMSGQV